MANESIEIIKTDTAQLKIKKSQLSGLEIKQTEESEKAAKLSKLLDQAKLGHEANVLSNLAGSLSDQELIESKINLKGLSDSLQECQETLKTLYGLRPDLNHEIIFLKENIATHRSIVCSKLSAAAQEAIVNDKKIREKMMASYAMFLSTGHFDRSWLQHLLMCFPHPSSKDLDIACEKFKASNEFMRD